ncbi:alpha/beta fold hydrolase [Sedimentibacter sp. zth1]|uniref:alpha/beta fold hydrolase n=1 Tax=Sedimentibacter sp. zth1 TaxID=2816908 RepID=UPI001A92465F|nr:alpha/beta hydrolase [Sedimentibacter sp. zth1]QSX05910.1 alpha/beta fold hydrolase [Sedimentibacter sp. zth1]
MYKEKIDYKIIGNGKNILVIEVGIGNSYYDWYPLVEKLKKEFLIILYHRGGYGKSSLLEKERTTRNIAKELKNFLQSINITEKFILLGHSFGGLCVQQYAKMYPNDLKAIVLLDSTSYDLIELENLNTPVINANVSIEKMIEYMNNSSIKNEEELKNENRNLFEKYKTYITDDEMKDVIDFYSNPSLYKVVANEFSNWIKDGEDIKSIVTSLNIPLKVIARDSNVEIKNWINYDVPKEEAILHEKKWRELQKELISLSSDSELIIANNSGHLIYREREEIIIECLEHLIK